MVKTYIFLVGAIFCEVAGTMLLPVSQNFTKLIPTVALSVFLSLRILSSNFCS
jgi:small multidrug resistance pump